MRKNGKRVASEGLKKGRSKRVITKGFLAWAFGMSLGIGLAGAGVFQLIDGLAFHAVFNAVGKTIGGALCLGAGFGIIYAVGRIVGFRP